MRDFFSVLEVASLLKISRSSVLYKINTGKLKASRVGKIYIISKEDFGDFLKTHNAKKKVVKQNQTTLEF